MTSAVAAPPSPYKGLAAYEDTQLDALLFFGREGDAEVIAANLLASRFTVLYGPAGVGKSSVLRAAVTRRVRALAPDAAVLVHDVWAGDPLANLSAAVAAASPAPESPTSRVPLADGLAELAERSGDRVYLILDQFEEVFTYSIGSEVAAQLAEAVTRDEVRVNVLLALRDDALSELDVFTGLIPDVFGNYLPLERLDRAAARAAVIGPVVRYNELSRGQHVVVEPELVEAVLDQVETGRVVLDGAARGTSDSPGNSGIEAPFLQLVLQRIWEAEQARGSAVLRLSTLAELGGAQEIVHDHLDRAIGALAPAERDVAARVFNHLVTPSGTKIAHGVRDLAQYAEVPEEELRPVLTSLGGDRILRPLDGRFEIFHDVLAGAVLTWRTRHEADRALARQQAEAERRHRRLIGVVAVSLVAVAAMTAVTAYALVQRGEARAEAERVRARSLEAQASALVPVARVEVDPELGVLLAAEAARLAPADQTEDILRRALLGSTLRAVLRDRTATTASFAAGSVVVGSEDGTVRVYGLELAAPRTTLRVGGPVTGATASPNGRLVLTTVSNGPARLWNLDTGMLEESLGRRVTAASFSPDGSLVATAEQNGARVWRTTGGTAVADLPQPEPAVQVAFGPDGTHVATVGTGRIVRVFAARSGQLVATVDHGGDVTSALLTPDGRKLVTTGNDRVARIWSLRRRARLLRDLPGHAGRVTAGALSRDGKLLATASTDGSARVWEVGTGSLVATLDGHTNHVTGVSFSPDGQSVVTWSSDRTARVWRSTDGTVRARLSGHDDAVIGASFNASGAIALTTSADGRVRLWRPLDVRLRPLTSVQPPVSAAAFSADGRVAAVAHGERVVVFETSTGQALSVVSGDRYGAVVVSGDGSLVAGAHGRRVAIWRARTGDLVGTLDVPRRPLSLALAHDGQRLVVGTGDGIGIWTAAGERVSSLSTSRAPTSLAFAPAGDRVAAGNADGSVAAWRVRDGRRLFQRQTHRRGARVLSVAFDAGGGRVVTAGSDAQSYVLDASSGRVQQMLRGHFATISAAAFSADGRWAVTAGPGTAGLWDLVSRQRLVFLEGHEGRLLAASFDAAVRRVLTVGSDGTLGVYDCETCGGIAELRRLAARRLAATGRELTQAERRRYFGGD
jgi:WD40 repeat protein